MVDGKSTSALVVSQHRLLLPYEVLVRLLLRRAIGIPDGRPPSHARATGGPQPFLGYNPRAKSRVTYLAAHAILGMPCKR